MNHWLKYAVWGLVLVCVGLGIDMHHTQLYWRQLALCQNGAGCAEQVFLNKDFSPLANSVAIFRGVEIDLASIDLRGIDFNNANFSDANLSGLDLEGANFGEATLTNTNFLGANLSNVQFSSADLVKVDFSEQI